MHQLDRRVVTVWRIGSLLGALPVVIAAVVVSIVVQRWWVIAPMAVLAILAVGLAVLMPPIRYRRWSYALREHDLILRHGVVVHVERMVPRTRVQHVDVIEGALARSLGLATLGIFTAGTTAADVALPGLAKSTAIDLRDELLSWIKDVELPAVSENATEVTPAVVERPV